MPTFRGVNFHFGAISTTYSGNASTQNRKFTKNADVFQVPNANGEVVAESYFNPSTELQFEFYPTGTGGTSGQLAVALPAPGTLATTTDSILTEVAGTNYIVQPGINHDTDNKGALKVTITLKAYPNVTS